MATNAPKIIDIAVHLPNGEVDTFLADEIEGYALTPAGTLLVVKHGMQRTRYANFPMIAREEISQILVPEPGDVPV